MLDSKVITTNNNFYVNIYERPLKAFNFFVGGRGTGKTFSGLSVPLLSNERICYMRNTDKQIEKCLSAFGNPYKKINKLLNRGVYMLTDKGTSLIVEDEPTQGDKEKQKNVSLKGYGVALSTFENLRGVDLSDVNYTIHDEFMQVTPLRYNQYTSLYDYYETVNRNREIEGSEPHRYIALSNARSRDNIILAELGLVSVIENMEKNGEHVYSKGDIYLELIEDNEEFLKQKSNTALNRTFKGDVVEEALHNKFAYDSMYHVSKRKLNEYRGLACIDGIYIYEHKSRSELYCCRSKFDTFEFNLKDTKSAFMRRYAYTLREHIFSNTIYYSEFLIKSKIEALVL